MNVSFDLPKKKRVALVRCKLFYASASYYSEWESLMRRLHGLAFTHQINIPITCKVMHIFP